MGSFKFDISFLLYLKHFNLTFVVIVSTNKEILSVSLQINLLLFVCRKNELLSIRRDQTLLQITIRVFLTDHRSSRSYKNTPEIEVQNLCRKQLRRLITLDRIYKGDIRKLKELSKTCVLDTRKHFKRTIDKP